MINKNMLRERAEKLEDITELMWETVLPHNKDMVQEFLDSNKQLSKQTLKQYISALRIFFYFIKTNLGNRPLYLIKKRDFIKYFSFLQEHNLSSSALKFKKSVISSLCKYIENIVAEDEEDYKNFRNFTTAVTDIPKNQVYEKIPITVEEYKSLLAQLEVKEMYLEMAWLATAFNVGARKSEIIQFKSEIVNYVKEGNNTYIETHNVRGKGRGSDGKVIKYMVNDEAIKYIKLWLDKRGYESEYIFTVNKKKMSASWANHFTQNVLSEMLGRRVHVHGFKASCVTNLLEQGVDMKSVSLFIAHHNDISTTSLYDLRSKDEAKKGIFK